MELLLSLTYASFFIFILYRFSFFQLEGITKHAIPAVFVLKIAVGLLLWVIYTFYYTNRATADIYKYFDDSKVIFDALKTKPVHYVKMLLGIQNNSPEFAVYYSTMNYWSRQHNAGTFNDGHTVTRLNAFLRLFSMGYYMVHTIFICFISLVGFTAIYKTFSSFFKDKRRELFLVVFLLPSVLFWSSGVLKEGILFFAMGLLLFYFRPPYTLKKLTICFLMAFLMVLSKFYVWIALMPSLLFLLIVQVYGPSKIAWKFGSVVFIFILLAGTIDRFSPIQSPFVTLSQKQIEFTLLSEGKLEDSNHQPIAPAGSSFTILFVFSCVVFHQPMQVIKWEHVLFCLSFVGIQFLIIGTTTPILGAIARYKVVALPFLLIAFLFILDKDKLVKRFPFIKKLFPIN